MVNKRAWNAVLGCNLKNDRMISVRFQGKPFNITVIQVYAPTSNAEEAKVERFYEDLQDLLELTPKNDVLSRNTWSNRHIWPWNTEWSRANRVLPRKCTGHNKHSLPTTQEKTLYMDITRWSTPKSLIVREMQIKSTVGLWWPPTQVCLPGEFHGQRSLAGYSPWGLKELGTWLSGCHSLTQLHNWPF